MKDIITSILTDAAVRDETAVKDELARQAVAIPWSDIVDPIR